MKNNNIIRLIVLILVNALPVLAVDIYVSPSGADSKLGSLSAPFATIARAQQAARTALAEGGHTEINVYIRGGKYYLPDGLVFGEEDTGKGSCRVSYCGYEQEMPYLIGGRKITMPDGAVKSVSIGSCPEDSELFADGSRVPKARLPKNGYFAMGEPVDSESKPAFLYSTEDFDPTGWDTSCGQINYWPIENWFNMNSRISSIDPAAKKLVIDTSRRELRSGNRYYLYNIPQLLSAGECVINYAVGEILYLPEDERAKSELVVSTAGNLIRLKGSEQLPVKNLHFQRLHLGIARENIFDISYAGNCSVSGCLIENAGESGVNIHRETSKITISDNEIRYNGLHGVALQGLGRTKKSICYEHTIANNHIYSCGRHIGHGNGVYTSQSGYNQIVHNHIHDMPRYGITVKGERYKTIEGQVAGMTWENRYEYMPARNNYIAFNDVHHVNLDSQDTGAIESWGPGRDNVIHSNLIHDSGTRLFNIQSGIYLDDQADYWTVTNNIIYNIVGSRENQCIYAKGIGNRIENNILIGSDDCTVGIKSFYMADERCDNHEYRNNIFYFALSQPRAVYAYDFVNYTSDRLISCDNNIFFATKGSVTTHGSPTGTDFAKWLVLENNRYDQHSLQTNPKFVNPANNDYSIQPDSPALKLGFKPVNISEIGLTKSYPSWLNRN